MTFEKLLDNSADKLEAMTNDELLEFYKPYLKVTRPELAEKPIHRGLTQATKSALSSKQQVMAELAKRGLGHIKW